MIRDGEGYPITEPLSAREKHWLRAYLEANPDALPPGHNNEVRSTETIVEDLSNRWDDRGILGLVRKWRESRFLPDSDLEWISSGNQRQLIWLINELAIRLSVVTPPDFDASTAYVPDPLNCQPDQRYPLVIAAIDAWPISIEKKRKALEEFREKWVRAQIPDKQIKWLDGKNSQQMTWAISYLGGCDFWKRHRTTFGFPSTEQLPKDKYAHILGFLDHLYDISPDTQELFLAKMKKTWSQRKYQNSEKAKKQVYFSLSDEARRNLDQLEKARKVTKNRIIEDLLAQAVGSRR